MAWTSPREAAHPRGRDEGAAVFGGAAPCIADHNPRPFVSTILVIRSSPARGGRPEHLRRASRTRGVPPPVQNRPTPVDGLDADGIGFSSLPVRISGTPPSQKNALFVLSLDLPQMLRWLPRSTR